MRDSSHLNFGRDRHLLFNVFCGMPRPLGDDIDVIIGDVWIGFDREIVERDCTPSEKQDRQPKQESGCSAQSQRAPESLRLQSRFQLKYI